ncbi:EAL domain-containing protein [Vibrio sp. SCSIO 43137]|uniref:EAL domain-containing protein n=1 Tax=Vibrio sp. SCSIO 43137 TaxID=3021011 RepID=UPI0023073B3E|nr:EAL domain-containing protein [Vibrio sp. SCSIO 43137]WCE28714.1 EAL domain-containing protein [Vibrio sp. SCSIO 43137]
MDRKLILIVDDDEMTRLLLREALSSQQLYTIYEAEDGAEALELYSEHNFSLVLLDVDLPKLNGFEVCKFIRESAIGQDVPIIMITGMDDKASIEKAYELGATDFMVKPINWSLISHHVRYVMRSSRNLKALRDSENKLEHAQRIAHLGYWELDCESLQIKFSRQAMRMLSLSSARHENGAELFVSLVHKTEQLNLKLLLQRAITEGASFTLDARIALSGNDYIYTHIQGQKLKENSSSLVGTIQDISELKESQARLSHVANYDLLTDLPNRILFQQLLERAILRAERYRRKVALLYIDLDRFKNVNDSLGHDAGDALLVEVARRLKSVIRSYDGVARLGGDEFAITLDAIENEQDAIHFTHRVLNLFQQPFSIAGKTIYVEASIGISFYPDNGVGQEELLRNADTAMYQAKRSDEQRLAFYSDELTEQTLKMWTLENELRKALEKQQFSLVYQPKVQPDGETVVGVEALLRWNRPDLPSVSPAEFIPVAEETGLIIPIGKWVIVNAIKQLQSWKGTSCEHLSIAVNVSGRQLHSQELSQFIEQQLNQAGVCAHQFELEITEDFLIEGNSEKSSPDVLDELDNLGIRMAIDDFGTGYSSLSQLKNLPISILKIDKTFVDNIPANSKDVAIIKSIVSFADNLGLQVVAEGVETREQAQCLRQYGCGLIQGYYYSKPVSAEEIMQMIENRGNIVRVNM